MPRALTGLNPRVTPKGHILITISILRRGGQQRTIRTLENRRREAMAYRLGVDVGGTFTDLMLVHDESGRLYRVKTPSTPADPSEGVLIGTRRILEESGVAPGELAYVMHGTTVATNALLESKGSRVGLITTRGFGQILHLARSQTPGPLAGWMIMIKPDPPAALEDTREAHERMDARGEVMTPVDREQIQHIVKGLVESGVESLTVSLINSYANPAHEREIGALIEELYPGFSVTLSSDVLPEFREYERTLTACMNSYVRPKVSDPSPVCYGKGGTALAVTDANVVVGHLPPRLLGGEMTLDAEAAKTAVAQVGDALGLDVHRAAQGILDIVNENMAGALRLVSVQRGYDPHDFAMVAFGGAGPLHANAVAALMGSFPVLIPPGPGLLCASGDLVADFREEFSRTLIRTTAQTSGDEVAAILHELRGEAEAWLEREGQAEDRRQISYGVDMRYYRQGYEIPIDVSFEDLAAEGIALLDRRFNEAHEQLYGFRMDSACEIVNLRAVGVGKVPEARLAEAANDAGADASSAVVDEHQVYFEGDWVPTRIYDRSKLQCGNAIVGPPVITEFDSTTVVLTGFTAQVDRYSNIMINPSEA